MRVEEPASWLRTAPNAVRWTIENTSSVPLVTGTVRARWMTGGTTAFEESRPLTSPAASEATVSFELPAFPEEHGHGELLLEVEDGLGAARTAHLVRNSALVASALAGATGYSAGEAGEIVLTLTNYAAYHKKLRHVAIHPYKFFSFADGWYIPEQDQQ